MFKMDVEAELLKSSFCNRLVELIKDFPYDSLDEVSATAIKMIKEIQAVLVNDEYNDYDVVEAIVEIFEKYDVDSGARNDY